MNEDFYKELWGSSEEAAPSVVKGMNSVAIAKEFERQLFNQKWCKGFAAVNVRALAAQIAKWKRAGQTEETVRRLIETYMTVPEARGANPGWRDFIFRAEQIAAMVPQAAPKSKYELLDAAYEIGTLEAFQEAFPDDPEQAQRYYDDFMEV